MSSQEERMLALEAKVDAMDRRASERSAVEANLLEAARQWARLTLMGYFNETMDGHRYQDRPQGAKKESFLRLFDGQMKRFAEDLIELETK